MVKWMMATARAIARTILGIPYHQYAMEALPSGEARVSGQGSKNIKRGPLGLGA